MFIFYLPDAILISAAVIPAIALLVMVYRADHVDKENPMLLARLVLMGVFATSIAKLLEYAGMVLLDSVFRYETVLYNVLMYFGVVAFAEEGAKYALLKRTTWGRGDFNCRFDGVVYATFVSLGFALWENIGYVMMNGLGTALLRAVTAVPGHACFGVFMGCWYAQAYEMDRRGDARASKRLRVLSVLLPALLHGAYDYLAVGVGNRSGWFFLGFVALLFIITYRLIGRLSREDRYI